MMNLKIDEMLVDIEDNIEKADYMADNIIETYELNEEITSDTLAALIFAANRKNIGRGLWIIRDYIDKIRDMLADVREAVEA